MIGYVCLGTNNIERATQFYDALFAVIGAKRQMELERGVAWGMNQQSALLAVLKPFDGAPATVGNGVMVSIVVDSHDKVDALHSQAIALHAQDEGLPGQRSPSFYAGYFRDLDGNKLCAFCMG